LSAIKGLAEVLQKPIATISLLHALATSANRQGKVIAALDAGRSEVYTGIYECNSADATLVHEQLLTGPEFLVQATQDQISARVTSDAAITDMACRAGADIQRVKRPGSEAIARIGVRKLLRGETVSIEDLDANYLRRSDAEIFFKSNR
jgi:tRNA threonylcarbamoyladenosine biosynthesis protein TsaB